MAVVVVIAVLVVGLVLVGALLLCAGLCQCASRGDEALERLYPSGYQHREGVNLRVAGIRDARDRRRTARPDSPERRARRRLSV